MPCFFFSDFAMRSITLCILFWRRLRSRQSACWLTTLRNQCDFHSPHLHQTLYAPQQEHRHAWYRHTRLFTHISNWPANPELAKTRWRKFMIKAVVYSHGYKTLCSWFPIRWVSKHNCNISTSTEVSSISRSIDDFEKPMRFPFTTIDIHICEQSDLTHQRMQNLQ